MGKRKTRAGLSGLSRFIPDSFGKNPIPDSANEENVDGHESAANEIEAPEAKKRKTSDDELMKTGHCRAKSYDATGLVPHYQCASELPESLHKYFSQRYRLFSLYSEPPGCLLDEEGWFSVTPELVAGQIAERCRSATILDAFCGVGGNTIAFAQTCERVIAIDTSPVRIALARHNAQIYGVADRIEFVIGDFCSFANSYLQLPNKLRKIDVVFLSPPWGGPSYLCGTPRKSPETPPEDGVSVPLDPQSYSLSSIRPIPGDELFNLSRKITQNIAYYLPKNIRLEEVSALLTSSETENFGETELQQVDGLEMVEVEEEWMGSNLKALTCYFGGLAAGQEGLFDAVQH